MTCTDMSLYCVTAAGENEDSGIVAGWLQDAWEKICQSFADAAVEMLEGFAHAFTAMPELDLTADGIQSAYAISLGLGIFVGVILFLVQIGATALTHSGKPLAQGMIGIVKAFMAFILTLTFAATALVASDQLADGIIERTFGTDDQSGGEVLREQFAALFSANAAVSIASVLILAIAGIVLTLVLWFELLLRNAALAVLIATSPIAAAGQVGSGTAEWWSKLVRTTIQLILLKPIIALIFCIGFSLLGGSAESGDLAGTLSGMLVLLLAALAWPAVARFMTFASASVGGGAGLAAVAGAGAGAASQAAMGPAGIAPAQFAGASAARSSGAVDRAQQAASAAGKGGGAVGSAAKLAGPWGLAAAAGLSAIQKGANTLVQRSEAMAGHGGVQGANPYALPAGQSFQNLSAIQAAQANRGTADGDQRQGKGAPRGPESPPTQPPAPPNAPLSGSDK
jgi:hypothetical protein